MTKPLATLVSLGCAKNLVDSETMVPQILNLGYEMTSDPSRASLVVVNTCGFLESAVQEAVGTILDLARHKDSGACDCLVVTGCMVQRYGKKLLELLPEVDLFLGTSHYQDLQEALAAHSKGNPGRLRISAPCHVMAGDTPRIPSTPSHWAYLKIAEGCSNRCSFCLIPHLRGPYRSRPVEDVLQEAARLADQGVVELNVIAQDITAYGSDIGDPEALLRLLEGLERIERVAWVRLLYAYPDRMGTPLLQAMSRSGKVVPYLDIPLQHCVPKILKAMRRGDSAPDAARVVDRIRSHIPHAALRTSLMVGFPGETDADFESLLQFVRDTRFDHAGVFAFSPEAGTHAARLPGQVSDGVKEERRRLLLETQQAVSRELLHERVGRILPVLIDGRHPETELLLAGRLETQAPEVDGMVIVTKGTAEPGRIVRARITASHDYDLEAELLSGPELSLRKAQGGTLP